MRIWYIANIRFPTEKAHGIQVAKACEALQVKGEEVTLLVPSRRTPIVASSFEYYGIKTPFLVRKIFTIDLVSFGLLGFWVESFSFAFAALFHLRSHLKEVIYGRDELVLFVLALAGAKNIFWESHDGTWNFFSRYIASRAQGIVVVSKGLRDFYIEKGVPADTILAVPNGIDLCDFANPESKEDARARLGLPLDKKIALYIGRLDGWKGTDTLLEASKLLPEGYVVALIGGEKQQIEKLKVQYKEALFLGPRPYSELPHNQAAADVLVVPNTAKNDVSVRFTSPLKLIAHMASNRPIVASNLPSIRELVDTTCAVLVEPDSPQELAAGIEKAAASTGLKERSQAQVANLQWSTRAGRIIDFVKAKMLV